MPSLNRDGNCDNIATCIDTYSERDLLDNPPTHHIQVLFSPARCLSISNAGHLRQNGRLLVKRAEERSRRQRMRVRKIRQGKGRGRQVASRMEAEMLYALSANLPNEHRPRKNRFELS